MKHKRTIAGIAGVLATVLLLAGCTNEIIQPEKRSDGKARVSFTAPIVAEGTPTRAALTEKTTVRVVVFTSSNPTYTAEQTYYADASGKLKPCTVNNDGTFKAEDTTSELALYPGTYDFYAYTPALPLTNRNSITVPNGVDYASSVTSGKEVKTDMSLALTTLARQCAKIALVVKTDPANTLMTGLSVAAAGVTINNLPAATAVGLNKPIAQASGSATLGVPQTAFKTVSATESSAITYLLPRLGENRMKIDYSLTYTVSGSTETKTISGTMGNTVLDAGKEYTFTLTMRQAGASLAVTEWIESNQEVATGESFDYSKTGNPAFLIGLRNMESPVDGTETMNWYVANGVYDATHNSSTKKACPEGWKLPTHEELMLMYIVKSAFPPAYLPADGDYWSSTQYDDTYGWVTRFSNGYTFCNTESGVDKTTKLKVRCIRDYGVNGKNPTILISTDNKVIIDNRNILDAAIYSKAKARTTQATNTTKTTVNDDTDIASEKSNMTISHYFEVAKKDYNETETNWISAVNSCNTWTEDGGNWRLPTQKEVMLLSILSKEIEQRASSIGFSSFKADNYWSATESLDNYSWCGNFNLGTMSYFGTINGGKTKPHYVRCVRDVGFMSQLTVTADYAQWGNSFTANVPFNSLNGAVTIKSIDNTGADKNWVTSAIISGTTSGNVVITYAPTAGNNGVHNDVNITLANQGGFIQTITVKYDNGFIPNSALSTSGWTTNLPGKGIQVAKMGNKLPSATADASPANSELVIWGADQSVSGAQQSGVGKGQANTTAIISSLGNSSAANKCTLMGAGWYWSSLDELAAIQKVQKNYLGGSYRFEGSAYWTSTEINASTAQSIHMSTGDQTQGEKKNQSRIRCVRDVQ